MTVRKSIARLKKSLMYKIQVVKSFLFSSKCLITTEIALGRESIRNRGHGFYSLRKREVRNTRSSIRIDFSSDGMEERI